MALTAVTRYPRDHTGRFATDGAAIVYGGLNWPHLER